MARRLFMAAALALLGIVPQAASATTYEYSYTFDLGTTISGSFSGTAVGDLIVDPTDVVVNVEGNAFQGNRSLAEYSWNVVTNTWVAGGAYFSFDGLQNNFMFSDSATSSVLDWTNQFFSITGDASSSPIAPPEIAYGDRNVAIGGYIGLGDFPPNSSWRVTVAEPITAVPEPMSVVLLLSGLALTRLGAAFTHGKAYYRG